MTKIIKGTLSVGRTAISQGKNVVTSLNSVNVNSNNGFVVDSYTTDQVLSIMSVIPISNFIPNTDLVTTSGFIINFNSVNPALLAGQYLELPITSFNLSNIKSNPANTTFHVYIVMEQGLAKYKISDTVIAETGTTAYNLFWIGTITTNAIIISTTNINSRSRLDVFSPSTTAAGASFPVSTGNPSQSGTISW